MGSNCCGSLNDDSSFSTKVSQAHLLRNRRQSAAMAASLKVSGQASAAATSRRDTVSIVTSLSTTTTHNPIPRDNDLQSPSTTAAGNDEASFTHQDQTAISNSTTTAGAGGGMATEGSASRWPAVRLAPSYCDEMRSFQTVSTTATNSTGSPTTNVQQQTLSVSQKVFNPLSLGRVDSDTRMFEAAVENAPAALAPHSAVVGVLSFGTPSSSQVASTPGEFSTTVARPSTSATTSNNIPPNRSGGERAARSAAVAVGEDFPSVQRQRSTQSLWGRSSATEIGSADLVGNMSDAFSDGRASTATRGPCRAPSIGELQTTGSSSRRVVASCVAAAPSWQS